MAGMDVRKMMRLKGVRQEPERGRRQKQAKDQLDSNP